jgi:hypothetical protein
MGCVQSKQGADVIEADPYAKDTTKLTIYATAGEASEAEQQRTAENGFKAPFRRISNKIIPVIDYLAIRALNHTSVVPFRDSHGHIERGDDSTPGLAYLRYCPTAPKRWKKGEAIGSGSFGNVFVGLNLDTGRIASRGWHAACQCQLMTSAALKQPKDQLETTDTLCLCSDGVAYSQ